MKEFMSRRIVVFGLFLTLVLLGIFSSFAYFVFIKTNEPENLSLKAGNLSLIFEDGNSGISGNLEVGKSITKTFTIENTGTIDTYAIMKFEDMVNTYTLGSLTYTLEYSSVEDGNYIKLIDNRNVPRSSEASTRTLISSLDIPSKTKYYYKLSIKLNYLENVDQTADYNALFSTHFKIDQNNTSSLETLHQLGLKVNENEPNFSLTATTDETRDGLFSMEDDYGTSYYYRGAVENNYVKFAGFYWRIIRINGDGSLRLIYDGTKVHKNGESSTDRSPIFSSFNSNPHDAKYLGYMYGGVEGAASTNKADGQKNETDSNAKKLIDAWYKENIEDKGLGKYISDTLFCNDRSTALKPNTWESWDTTLGYAGNYTVYGIVNRTRKDDNWIPVPNISFKCPNKNDTFTVNDTMGNTDLTYPVGMITLDEVISAGSKEDTSNTNFYLYKGHQYWTMTPGSQYVDSWTDMGKVWDYGGSHILGWRVDSSFGINPVINIKSVFVNNLVGSGNISDPYQIKEENFDVPSAVKAIKKNKVPNGVNNGEPVFANATTRDEGVFSLEDDYGTSYYFRGSVSDNYVKFAGFYWRIIRVNGDGSVRMIYDGTSAHVNGEASNDRTAINDVAYNVYTHDNKYVGYMYGGVEGGGSSSKEEAQKNEVDSNVKKYTDEWYKKNIEDKGFGKYVSDSIFCNDRKIAEVGSTTWPHNTGLGYGANYTLYNINLRVSTDLKDAYPTFKCSQNNDKFTVDSKNGNGDLTYPVGLLTADELTAAGRGNSFNDNLNYYLYKGRSFWTMTPHYIFNYGGRVGLRTYVYTTFDQDHVNYENGSIAPVINIKPEYAEKFIGLGSINDPYRIEETEFSVKEAVKAIKSNQKPKYVKDEIPNFGLSATSDEGVFAMEDDYGTSYYFRGAVLNNYLKFAGFYWRIIRINGDGSVRVIYDGTRAHINGDNNIDRIVLPNTPYNLNYNDNKYGGYMFGPSGTSPSTSKEESQSNVENSNIKTKLEEWYEDNIEEKHFGSYVSDTLFCNDRTVGSGLGYGANSSLYGANYRLGEKKEPQLICPQANDKLTVTSNMGNKVLTYPVGLITADEMSLAGGIYALDNLSYYLHKGYPYWSMTQSSAMNPASAFVVVINVHYSGTEAWQVYSTKNAAVPVINIKSEYAESMKGSGYMNDPYTIE